MSETSRAEAIALSEPPLSEFLTLHVLKQDDLFAVFGPNGDIQGLLHPVGPSIGADGLFQDDTRVLSRLTLSICNRRPALLGSAIGPENVLFTVDQTNPPLVDRKRRPVPADQLHLARRRMLWRRKLFETLRLCNYMPTPVEIELEFDVDADFRDVFEIRGATRAKRGQFLPPVIEPQSLTLSYRGLDGRLHRTVLAFSMPVRIRGKRISLPLLLPPGETRHLLMTISSDGDTTVPTERGFHAALKSAKRQTRRQIRSFNRISSDNTGLDRLFTRASADLALLVTELKTGPYPYAGVPWFSVPFGRDAVITALQLLWLEPSLARGVLAFLSAGQAMEESTFLDAQPGKIMHETRKGEMATLNEVPFARYYGGVDTTPLFVLLAGAYLQRTNDVAFLREIWPAVHAALGWIDIFGDLDGDGLVEYLRGAETGLQNQGWKDSADSIFHGDGELATGAIALVEVQAYVAAAKEAAAAIAETLGDGETAKRLLEEAERLRQAIEDRFWCEELGLYALALDGEKRPCKVRASNAGHVLFCGAASPPRARRVAEELMSARFFTGWGVRTLAEGEARYNPISYHNGTVWPHDTSIAAAGMARYGMTEWAGRLFTGLFEAACRLPDHRLPELFCGFRRRRAEGPVAYPSACTPQAWATGAPFLLLQSCLGIEIDAPASEISISGPYLPAWIDELHVRDLAVGDARASLYFRRAGHEIEAGVSEATSDVQLVRSDR